MIVGKEQQDEVEVAVRLVCQVITFTAQLDSKELAILTASEEGEGKGTFRRLSEFQWANIIITQPFRRMAPFQKLLAPFKVGRFQGDGLGAAASSSSLCKPPLTCSPLGQCRLARQPIETQLLTNTLIRSPIRPGHRPAQPIVALRKVASLD